MRCPTCKREFYPQPDEFHSYWVDREKNTAYQFQIQQCPSCYETIVIRELGTGYDSNGSIAVYSVTHTEIIFPAENEITIAAEVPTDYASDFLEANAALQYSSKASAALSRRLLQKTLRERLNIIKRDLSQEIDEFIENSHAPTYLTDAIDAVRQIGNFAAHPIKYTNTSEIVEVEAGEAEWILEVLDSLFDFVFVQPKKLEQRRNSLNDKLRSIGKPELKSA